MDGKQEMAHPLGSLRYTCTSTSVRFFPANGYEGLYEGRYGDNFTVNGEPVTKENAQTLLEALFFLKDEGGGETLKTINGIALPGAGNIVLNQYIQHYKWTTNAATTRKQVPTTLRANGIKISYNDNSGVYHVEQYQSDDLSDEAWASDANWKGCRTPMTPMFEAAGATFNDETGLYRIDNDNGIYLDDLTENEVVEALLCRIPYTHTYHSISFYYNKEKPRIYFPIHVMNATTMTFGSTFQSKKRLECFGISINYPVHLTQTFHSCDNLRQVFVKSNTEVTTKNAFSLCKNIELLKMQRHRGDMDVSYSPLITLDSFQYNIDNSVNTEPATWVVHPDVYAKLTDEANAEWYAVNTAAQAKQIAFATTDTAQVAMLAMRTLPEPQALDGELLAPAGCYLTQAEETPIENRLFLTRKVILPGEDVSKWRVATMEEKREQDEYFEQQLPN